MERDEFLGPANSEMAAVEKTIRDWLASGDGMLRDPSIHLLEAGGKRLRPGLVLLSALCCRYDPRVVVPAAAAMEMIHMATLIHDDIIDNSRTRRGYPTVNSLWGEKTALLTGDYLLARAFTMLAGTAPGAMRYLSAAVDEMCLGQASEMLVGPCLEEGEYLRRIERKTAAFMSACCRLGSGVGRASRRAVEALSRYGRNLGMAFQLMDDILDITGDPREMGKPVANDLRQGVFTLPVIHSLSASPRRARLRAILDLVNHGETDGCMEEVVSILDASGSIEYARSVAGAFALEAGECLSNIPPSDARDSLLRITEFVVRRGY